MKTNPLRSADIRERNEKLILHLIFQRGKISQSEVGRLTGLKPPTVLRIFTILERDDYITPVESPKEETEKKGRKPAYYSVNPEKLYALGVDFWAGSSAVMLVDFEGKKVASAVEDFPAGLDAAEVMRRLEKTMKSVLRSSGVAKDKILGIGVGAPGRVDISNGVLQYYSRIRGMKDYPIGAELAKKFDLPVFIHNNCSVVAMSEYRYGVAGGVKSLLTILLRAGVGGAFIQDGKAFLSREKTTLEVGHMSVDIGGASCQCGGKGCLETRLAEEALIAGLSGVSSIAELGEALAKGQARAEKSLRESGEYLYLGLRNLVQLFGPEALLIVTRSKAVSDFFARWTEEKARTEEGGSCFAGVKILAAEYNPVLAGRSAADLVFDDFFSL